MPTSAAKKSPRLVPRSPPGRPAPGSARARSSVQAAQGAGAVAEGADGRAHALQHGDVQVAQRRVPGAGEVPEGAQAEPREGEALGQAAPARVAEPAPRR